MIYLFIIVFVCEVWWSVLICIQAILTEHIIQIFKSLSVSLVSFTKIERKERGKEQNNIFSICVKMLTVPLLLVIVSALFISRYIDIISIIKWLRYQLIITNKRVQRPNMIPPNKSSTEFTGWSSGEFQQNGSKFYKVNHIIHSTPLKFRPLPGAPPNISPINKPINKVHHFEELIERMAQLKLDNWCFIRPDYPDPLIALKNTTHGKIRTTLLIHSNFQHIWTLKSVMK